MVKQLDRYKLILNRLLVSMGLAMFELGELASSSRTDLDDPNQRIRHVSTIALPYFTLP